jgi:hypothetical protein
MIPVLSGQQMLSYLDNVSKALNPGDFWIGSIAIPEGKKYEMNNARARAGESSAKEIRATPFGGITFVHRPEIKNSDGTSVSDKTLADYLSVRFNLSISIEDLYTPVLNSYYTIEEFDKIVKTKGLEIAESARVECEDNATPRLVVALRQKN